MAQAKVLSASEVQRALLVAASTRNPSRNRITLLLSILGGLRVGEIAALRLRDVLAPNHTIVSEIWLSKDQTKGHKGRTVFLSAKLQRELKAYVGGFKRSDLERALIPSNREGKHFSNTTLCMLIGSIYRKAGLKTSSHSGRRTFATRLNEQGVGMRTIQKLMGHKHISTTAIYCEVSDTILRNAVDLLS
jgi:integrase/recombinase XerD